MKNETKQKALCFIAGIIIALIVGAIRQHIDDYTLYKHQAWYFQEELRDCRREKEAAEQWVRLQKSRAELDKAIRELK